MYEVIVIHYGEIGTKGKNRDVFEKNLMKNIKEALHEFYPKVYRRYGRIICEVKKWDLEKISEILSKLPGIEYFSFAVKSKLSMEKLKEKVKLLLNEKKFSTFKVETRRSYKDFSLTSIEVNKILGEFIIAKLKRKVNLKNPDLTVYVEICEKEIFVYLEKHKGIGGLPVGVSGKIVSLLSGGIDSPVASFLMMKRGCKVIFLHFFNRTIVAKASLNKVKEIVNELTKIQLYSKLYLIPFEKFQMEIIKHVPSKYRMLVYRRAMLRIANRIAEKENAKGIVTGDSIGQVASQTLDNLNCIYEASKLPIFTPLIGMNKMEIVKLAKEIGTYEFSILPYEDCCSFMIARHPSTRASLEEIQKFEEKINMEKLVEECIKNSEVYEYSFK